MNKQQLADKARAAMRARIMTGEPFRTSDLSRIGVSVGQSTGTAGNTASNLIQSLKGTGVEAIASTGPTGPNLWQMKDPPPRSVEDAPLPVLVAPNVVGPYDPDPKVEGRNQGLTEALAEKLWKLLGGGDEVDEDLALAVPMLEADGWRRLSLEVQRWMFERGFVGPGGERAPGRGLDYSWVYQCADWSIQDADGGHVALISDDQDVPLFLAAPRMRDAIQTFLARFEAAGGIQRSDIQALAASLPEETTT